MQGGYNFQPGMLLLAGRRVLVVGGDCDTAEVLTLPRFDNDLGQWTVITQPMNWPFLTTHAVLHKGRILLFSECILFRNFVL